MNSTEEFLWEWRTGNKPTVEGYEYLQAMYTIPELVKLLTDYDLNKWTTVETLPPLDEINVNLSIDVIGWDEDYEISVQCFYDFNAGLWFAATGEIVNIIAWQYPPTFTDAQRKS